MSRQKMMPPSPLTNESEHDRFKKFAKAILAVPRSEIGVAVTESMKQKASRTLKPEKAIKPHKEIDLSE
jgi:hypothetical protein